MVIGQEGQSAPMWLIGVPGAAASAKGLLAVMNLLPIPLLQLRTAAWTGKIAPHELRPLQAALEVPTDAPLLEFAGPDPPTIAFL